MSERRSPEPVGWRAVLTVVGRVIKGLGALALLAAIAVGIPWALWHFIGWPLPHHVPSWTEVRRGLTQHGISNRTIIDVLAIGVWISWACLVLSILAEVPATVRGHRARRVPVAGIFQPLTGQLVALVLLAALSLAPKPVHVGASAHLATSLSLSGQRPPAAAVVLADATNPTAPTAAAPPASAAPQRIYVVQPRDTLWAIAERELGNPLRWSEIYELNAGRPEPDGAVLDDPHWIYAGWTLVLPSEPAPPSPPAEPPPSPSQTSAAPPPAPTPRATAAPSSPTTTPRPPPSMPDHAPHSHSEAAAPASSAPVTLPSGSVVAGSFAAGVLSAVALGRLRRRHAYRYHPPEAGPIEVPTEPRRPTLDRLSRAMRDRGWQVPTPPPMADDDPDHRERPDVIEIGERDGESVAMALSELSGVALDGLDTDAVVRAWVAAVMARAGPLAADVFVTEAAWSRLLPEVDRVRLRDGFPATRVLARALDVARYLEAEALSRTRQLDQDEAPDIVGYRRKHPGEPVPGVLAVVESVPAEHAARFVAVAAAGRGLGLALVVLDPPGAGVHLSVDEEEQVTLAEPASLSHLVGLRLFSMSAPEAAEVVGALNDAEDRPDSTSEEPLATEVHLADTGASRAPVSPPVPPSSNGAVHARAALQVHPVEAAPITASVLGPYVIEVNAKAVATGLWTTAKELLLWYLLHPEGTSIEVAVDQLWPETDRFGVHRQFWRAAGNLRTRLGRAAQPPAQLVIQAGDVYRLEAGAITSDLWTLEEALADAGQAKDDEAARAALRRATQCYRGDLADGADFHWLVPIRQELHTRILHAHLRLAELEDHLGASDAALAALERGTEIDRYGEEAYRRLMTLHAGHGRVESVGSAWRQLVRRLAEIGVDPEPATVRLYRSLTEEDSLARRNGRSS